MSVSPTGATTFRATCDATETVVVCKPWVMLCRTSKTNGLTEAIVLGKAIRKLYWAERADAGSLVDDRLWVFITESEWEDECFLSKSQVYRALEKLEALGFVAQRRMQRQRGGNPVRHVTVMGDVIGTALEALAAGGWDPEKATQEVTSSRGRDEIEPETSSRERDETPEAGREVATSWSRGRDEPSRNKEELPPVTTAEPPTTAQATAVASDDGPGIEADPSTATSKPTPCPASSKDPSHPNYAASFDVMGAAFGLCEPGAKAEGLPVAARNSINRARKGAYRAGLLDDLALLADVVWVYRARSQCDIGSFAAAAADIALNPDTARLVAHRAEASVLVAEACAKLGLGPAGRALSRPAAEVAVARLLDGGVSADRVVSALREADGWTHGQLQTVLGRQRATVERGTYPPAPEDLGPVLTLDLIGLLRRGLPPMDVPRVAAEIQDRADRLSEHQRERVHGELTSGAFCEVNQIPTFVKALIRRYAPARDPELEAKHAANRAVWGQVGAVEQSALPVGGGS